MNEKYILIKAPYMLDNWLNEEFEIVDISGSEITLIHENTHACIVCSPWEFSTYFAKPDMLATQKEKKVLCKAGKWSDWSTVNVNGTVCAYKTNGKKIVVRNGGFRGESSCHSEDEFNLAEGLRLAVERLNKNKEQRENNTTKSTKEKMDGVYKVQLVSERCINGNEKRKTISYLLPRR